MIILDSNLYIMILDSTSKRVWWMQNISIVTVY